MNRKILEEALTSCGIGYNNQTTNAVNICCPFCNDEGYHCGVFLDNLNYHCWKCHSVGSLYELLRVVLRISYKDYLELFQSVYGEITDETIIERLKKVLNPEVEKQLKGTKEVKWPPPNTVSIEKMGSDIVVTNFLTKRNLELGFCIEKGVRIGLIGRLMNYFVVPVIEGGQVVAYQGRSMLLTAKRRKYMSEGMMGDFLYNYDEIIPDSPVAIVEGIFDCWSTRNSVASFGTNLSDTQIYKLAKLKFSEIILAWDIGNDGSDAFWVSRKVVERLRTIFGADKVKSISLPAGEDPASLGFHNMEIVLKNAH